MPPRDASNLPVLLTALHDLRGDFSAPARRRKTRLLRRLATTRVARAPDLLRLHDELLFLAAFPDTPTIAAAAERALRTFTRRTARLSPAQLARLADTGIAGTRSSHTFMYGVVRWLAARGERIAPAWRRTKDAERLDPLVRQIMLPAETEAFEDGGFSTRHWIDFAGARTPGGPLAWLVGAAGTPAPAAARDLYDEAEVPVTWSLADSPRSVTRNRGPVARRAFRTAFRRLPADPVAWVTRPLGAIRRVRGDEAARWLDASLAAIAARCREVAPTIYANPDEVYIADLGEGAELCVIGAHPTDRLALEANYGYVMFSNGVPIGYGGVTPLADQANTGANVFEAFRRSEAAYLFGQALRAFRGLFGSSRFVVNPYQFGAGNDEALQSGAFWFYDRLGFRSVNAGGRALAERERARLAAHPGTRSSLALLRRLARWDLVLDLDPASPVPRFDEAWLPTVGALVARSLAHVPAPSREVYLERLARDQLRLLAGESRPLTTTERRGARLLAPVIRLVQGQVRTWTVAERRALWEMVRARGAARERRFARLSRRHITFWRALAVRCRRARAR